MYRAAYIATHVIYMLLTEEHHQLQLWRCHDALPCRLSLRCDGCCCSTAAGALRGALQDEDPGRVGQVLAAGGRCCCRLLLLLIHAATCCCCPLMLLGRALHT
jgi:hypothetical protein